MKTFLYARSWVFVPLVVLWTLVGPVASQENSVRPGINQPYEKPKVEEFIQKFETESREVYAKRRDILAACRLRPGLVVADIGAGTGLFSRLFAQAVGPKGKVYAVDITPRFVDYVEKSCIKAGLKNVTGVVGTPTSVKLSPNSIDLAFICDTYHHFEFPYQMMASIHTALRPGGQVVLIDLQRIPGKSSDWIMNHVRAGQEVVTQEITSRGFKQVQQKPFLKENYLVRFEKVDRAEGQYSTFRYKKAKQGDLELHVHFPPDWKKGDQRAAIVFFFGGGWVGGTVNQFKPQAAYLAQRGLVAARADYRVKSRQGVSPAACVEDAKSAIRWIRQNAAKLGVDPNRMVAAGGSAGGHIAACSGCCPGLEGEGENPAISSRPNAMVLFNPVLRFAGVPELMQRIDQDEKLGQDISPILHLTKNTPPALLLYGKQDRLLRQGEEYLARAKEVGSRAELFLAPGVGHGFFNGPPWQERTLQRVDEFLGTLGYVKGRGTIRVP